MQEINLLIVNGLGNYFVFYQLCLWNGIKIATFSNVIKKMLPLNNIL